MALSLLQKDTLTTNATQLARTRQALREYAKYLKDIGNGATQAQKDWSAQVLESRRAPQIAVDMQGELVTDSKFASAANADATDVVDAEFKSAVEAICLKYV
jgi:hypothetical protein